MGKKASRAKYNNHFQVPNETAEVILRLSNKELADRSHLEYCNWQSVVSQKKDDPQIMRAKSSLQDVNAQVKEDPRYIAAEEELKRIKEELVSEEMARLQEELRNVIQPFTDDLKAFKNMFRLTVAEISRRKDSGSWGL